MRPSVEARGLRLFRRGSTRPLPTDMEEATGQAALKAEKAAVEKPGLNWISIKYV